MPNSLTDKEVRKLLELVTMDQMLERAIQKAYQRGRSDVLEELETKAEAIAALKKELTDK